MLNVVLVSPEIHQNTGNIARTCAATGARLHLIGPLGFEITDKALRRAGLDYWYSLDVALYDSLEEFMDKVRPERMWLLTTKAPRRYTDVQFQDGDYLFFGRESAGLPEPFLEAHRESCLKIPMAPEARSLNLSNSVAITVYEALRQLDFPDTQSFGKMKTQRLTRPY
jgi:tRNA (cytidine/uridine-2'-O-)-methyltransferase